MEIRTLDSGDRDAMRAFFTRIPDGDRRFFREDVLDEGVLERWLADRRGARLVAVDQDDTIRGYEALVPGVGWSSHVGDLRVIVDPSARGQGVGTALVREAVLLTEPLGLSKLAVEVVAAETGTVAMFRSLGFQPEALLCDHVRDRHGVAHDLMLLVHAAEDNRAFLGAMGIDGAVG